MDARSRTIGLAVLVAAAIGGCGGGDGGGGALNSKDYIAQADRICRESNDRILKIPAPKSADQVVDYVDKAVPQVDDALRRLAKLEAGDDIKPAAGELLRNLRKQRDVIRQIGDAAKKRDVKELTRVTATGATLAQATERKAKAAGFKACGIQQSGG
jgi:hypothetical protein